MAVPGVEDFLAWVVCHHAVVSKFVDEPYTRIGSTPGRGVVGVVDRCCLCVVSVDAVYNTTRHEGIANVSHCLRRYRTESIKRTKGQRIELGSTQLSRVT